MSKDYASRLTEFSETNYDTYHNVLNDCQNDIIDQFGGLDIMIQLCLTNPQFATDAYKSQFKSFKSFMESQNINIENDIIIEYKSDNDDKHQTTVGDKRNNEVILRNVEELYKYSFGIAAHYSDSLYFVFFPTKAAKYIFNHLLHTKVYPVCCTVIVATLLVTAEVHWLFYKNGTIYYILATVAHIFAVFASLSYIFGANISIVSFIIQTFDFWYKMYNLMLWIVSSYFIIFRYNENTSFYAFGSFTAVCVYCLSFIFDATSIENKYKSMFIISVASWGTFIAVIVYFSVDDTNTNAYWNPFERYNFKYSKIDFKSIFVSSQINLCLFMLKPIFSQINRKMRRCTLHKKNARESTKDHESLVQRSFVLYKRPYIHWVCDRD